MQKINKYILFYLFIASLSIAEGLYAIPEALYLTWSDDPCTTIDICCISEKSDEIKISYKQNDSPWQETTPSITSLNNKYSLHIAHISSLRSNTKCHFKINNNVHTFSTLPQTIEAPLQFIVSGDVYDNQERFVSTAKIAKQYNPAFALLGGDISDAKDSQHNINRWISFFNVWETKMGNDNKLIPILAVPGNHDTKGRFNGTCNYIHQFFPLLKSRGYNVLDIGNELSVFLLDSNHAVDIKHQNEDLEKWLCARNDRNYKIALYHVSAYPNVRAYEYKYSNKIRNNWSPIFEKYNIDVAFENHEHSYKRTVPILNNISDENGIVYIGGGGWGMKPRTPRKKQLNWYLAESIKCQHFLLTTIDNKELNIKAIDNKGNIIDQYTKRKNEYENL